MLTKFSRVKRSQSVEGASDVFEIKPTFMTPTKSSKKAIKGSGTEMSFRKGQKFTPACKTPSFGCMPPKMWESATQRVRFLNRPSGRKPRSHKNSIPIDKMSVLTCAVPIPGRGNHKRGQIGMDVGIDTIPELDCPITNRDKAVWPQKPLFEIVVEGDGVEHP
jgi:hypothetical protein